MLKWHKIPIPNNAVKNVEFELNSKDNKFLNSIQTLLKKDADEYLNLISSQQKVKELFESLVYLDQIITKGENKFLSDNTKTKDKANYSELDYIVSNYTAYIRFNWKNISNKITISFFWQKLLHNIK